MLLENLTRISGMTSQLARETGESQANIYHRVKQGWEIGIINGKMCMFNPKHVTEISEHHREAYDDWCFLEQRRREGREKAAPLDDQLELIQSGAGSKKPD